MNRLELVKKLYLSLGASDMLSEILTSATTIILILVAAFFSNYIAKKYLIRLLKKIVRKTKTEYDDIIFDKKVLFYITHLIPVAIIHLTIDFAFKDHVKYPFDDSFITNVIHNLLALYVYVILWLVIFAAINAFYEIFQKGPLAKRIDIKSFLQLIKVLVALVFIILIVSEIINEKPGSILTAFGALAAALMFVFKDTLMGFVAGIQLAANKMVKPGDWISMPSMGADGDVIEIGLTTVKVQNFDKTISTIPTYALVSKSFANWKGMVEAGARRIKRSLFIDVKTIRFCSNEMLEKYKKIHLLKDYIEAKEKEIEQYNKEKGISEDNLVNSRHLTNVGTFRKYIEFYLKEHPKINTNLTLLVRQLEVTPEGLPMQIYVFSSDNRWVFYEAIQADIFDHIFSVIPEFGLQLYQNPTGEDFKRVIEHR